MRSALGFTGARLYSTMALWPGAFSVRRESLLGEAPPFGVQEYLVMMMVSRNAETFVFPTGWECSTVACSRLDPCAVHSPSDTNLNNLDLKAK